MKFRDPERQARFEKLNSEGLTLESLIQNFNAARLMLSEVMAEGPGDNAMAWTEKMIAMEAQLSRAGDNLIKTSEKLNLMLNKDSALRLAEKLVEIATNILQEHVDPRTHEIVADKLSTQLSVAIREATN